MSVRMFPVWFMTVACLLGLANPSAAQCDPDGNVQFVCGYVNPEDLVAVPRSPWVIVSSKEGLHAADTRDHSKAVLFPTAAARPRHDTATYGACPGPITGEFEPRGLSLRAGTDETHTLYVVRPGTDGGRISVEVFEVDSRGASLALTWVGCVEAPDGVPSLNSVAALPGGGFAATNSFREGKGVLDVLVERPSPTGDLWEWLPTSGWAKIPGSETIFPNGLEASPDERWLYIGLTGTQWLIRLSRGQTPVQKAAVDLGFLIDNVRWAPDGSLFAAGFRGEAGPASIFQCMQGQCDGITAHVAKVDPQRLTAEEIVRYPSNEHFVLATVALQVGDDIWVGGVNGTDRIALFPAGASR